MGDLALLWGADVCCTDAAGISRGSGHVYATDWKSRLPMSQWGAVIGPVELGADVEKDLVVLGVTTGEELARIPLGPTSPTMSAVVPGAHDDVLVSTRGGLVRVVARRSR